MAQAVAQRFVRRGDQLFCLARNSEKMARVAEGLKEGLRGSYCFDFNDNAQAEAAVGRAVQCLGGIDIAFLAHGDLSDQLASEEDFAVARATIETNMLSKIALLIPLCRQLKTQGRGKIGVITSVAGERGRPRNFTYGAAKGGMTLYLQGLRSSLWQSGVEIYTFIMGPVDTPMTVDHPKNFSFATVDQVADKMVRAFGRRRYQIYVPGYWAWVMGFVRNVPESLFQKLKFLSER